MEEDSVISVEYTGRVAIITINNDKKLNALSQAQYYDLAQKLREVATHDEVYITLLIGKGRYFSAGADVSISRSAPDTSSGADTSAVHKHWLGSFVANNLNITNAFYTHPKILVCALNGPVIGLSAALISFADFIYCTPTTFLLTPFSSLGLVAEGGASIALVRRLGLPKANEALIMSRRIPSEELLSTGFVNKIFFPPSPSPSPSAPTPTPTDPFREMVLNEINERLGDHLVGDSLLGIKALIQRPYREVLDSQNTREVFAGLDRFMSGVPQEEFVKIATGKKRHKL
ncbi:ClpP/crotonase-like domain-containing protein [Diplogelasinospora grovesii]|uniref:ClpP/crotonase-like domain-containing protein n=1 Tax=Diplogelasinospora grovesii TaxID=303347 RepID=A0AAN6NGU3_9PEZI|nr:ClpP/crotonase-like domain-containing protein [Diplogelasinospora grovesii]